MEKIWKLLRIGALVVLPLSITSCLVSVESQIEPDETVDKRLIGVWTCVPIDDNPELQAKREEAASDAGNYREEDDIGLNGYLIFGESDDGTLEILGIEGFRGEPLIIKGRRAKTRAFGGRNYLLFELEGETTEEIPPISARFVVEYSILDDGSLRLWFLYIDSLEEAVASHKIEHVAHQDSPFGGATLKGSSDELLQFYSDPKVARLMPSAGRYRKLEIPANARVLGGRKK